MSSKYIVVFKKSASQEEVQKYADEVNANGGSVTNVYDSVLKTDSFLNSRACKAMA
ncbi:hypothetical protein PHLCEN_2v289 [Hermanssonia centrifuga]|uniref:Inhibitor I9 domain-containing protein n=1 Tax=Hermanssonia centrifuga TaxID=98765 RepID=A0A2R6S697_9APHY|nr:hypothetical protein PHLCEN_2v289 [Hermanssonia centrifuga]